ncbi:hypothetical protein [Dyadobacter sp. 676]|uniref:Lipoprotein n=1 Tax=Dyadobacter sp. 676 TaxID=3088362 RepID=A0AAU8FMV0_9BACT
MKQFNTVSVSIISFFLILIISCRELDPDTHTLTSKEQMLDKLTIGEAQEYYKDILSLTPAPEGNRLTAEMTGHPIEKDVNFDAAFTYQLPNVEGNIVVAPLKYKLMDETMYLAGDEAKGSKPKKEEFRKKEINHLNNLVVFKTRDGKVESCVQRIISFDTKKKKGPAGIKWANFSGLVEYFDWNENFLFGFVVKRGKVASTINSISTNGSSSTDGRTNACIIESCFHYYACSRNSQTGALENCSGVTSTCQILNVTCIDTSNPNLGYSIPPGMGGTYVDPNNPAVAAIWDRGQVVNQIQNNPMSLLNTTDCPQNVASWVPLSKFVPSQSVLDRLAQLNSMTLFNPYYLQTLGTANGTVVNCDWFSVTVSTLPAGYTNNPSGFLEYLRQNINSFATGGGGTTFEGHPQIPGEQSKWINDPYTSVVFIDVPGPQNGAVVTSQKSSDSWIFSTIHDL